MKNAALPVSEITNTAITLLCREIGAVNTARFLNQFTTGFGNYAAARDKLLGNPTVDELIAEIKQRRVTKNRRPKRHGTKPRALKR